VVSEETHDPKSYRCCSSIRQRFQADHSRWIAPFLGGFAAWQFRPLSMPVMLTHVIMLLRPNASAGLRDPREQN
jgi:hypothetical protein